MDSLQSLFYVLDSFFDYDENVSLKVSGSALMIPQVTENPMKTQAN